MLGAGSLVIFEGIHAINPLFEEHLPQERMAKIFVNTITPVYDGQRKLLAAAVSGWCGASCGTSGSGTVRRPTTTADVAPSHSG